MISQSCELLLKEACEVNIILHILIMQMYFIGFFITTYSTIIVSFRTGILHLFPQSAINSTLSLIDAV